MNYGNNPLKGIRNFYERKNSIMDEGYEPVNFTKNSYKALNVNIKKTIGFEDLEVPAYATKGSCAVDLRAAIAKEFIYLPPGNRAIVHAGFSMAIPAGFEAQIRPRSGLAIKDGISLVNSPGTIDSDYRGPVGVIVINHGTETFKIERGMRIAQMTIHEVIKVNWQERDELSSTIRGEGGFGSTGN